MQALFISTLGAGNTATMGSTPLMDACSLALFMAGAFLIAMGVYHVRRAPEQIKHPVVVSDRRR